MRPLSAVWVTAALLLCAAADAAQFRRGDSVTIAAGEVLQEDVYVAGGKVEVHGRVEGDLVVAGGELLLSGETTGDVMSAGGRTELSGQVGGSVRLAGGQATIRGNIREDLIAAGGNLTIAEDARVGRDLVLAGGEATVLGSVGQDLSAYAGKVTLAGQVGRDADVAGREVVVGDAAQVRGTLRYSSQKDARISSAASIGALREQSFPVSPGQRRVGWVVSYLRGVVGFLALGLLAALLSPRWFRRSPAVLQGQPLKAFGWGALTLILAPLALVLVLVAGIFFGGWWIALLLCAALCALAALAIPTTGLFIGRSIATAVRRPGWTLGLAMLLGVALLLLVIRIPALGALVLIATLCLGVGALALSAVQLRRAEA